jgi:hypothetical protein
MTSISNRLAHATTPFRSSAPQQGGKQQVDKAHFDVQWHPEIMLCPHSFDATQTTQSPGHSAFKTTLKTARGTKRIQPFAQNRNTRHQPMTAHSLMLPPPSSDSRESNLLDAEDLRSCSPKNSATSSAASTGHKPAGATDCTYAHAHVSLAQQRCRRWPTGEDTYRCVLLWRVSSWAFGWCVIFYTSNRHWAAATACTRGGAVALAQVEDRNAS